MKYTNAVYYLYILCELGVHILSFCDQVLCAV